MKNKTKRINWDEYFMQIAELVSSRSTCSKISVGCVITKDRRIIGTGYNGSPVGLPHCADEGCIIYNNHCIRSLHAEVNAILQCAMHGVSTLGSVIYITHLPCWHCSLMLINAGVRKISYLNDYIDDRGNQLELLNEADIDVEKINFK